MFNLSHFHSLLIYSLLLLLSFNFAFTSPLTHYKTIPHTTLPSLHCSSSTSFPVHLHLVTSHRNVYIFRGGLPNVQHAGIEEFDYLRLMCSLQQTLKNNNFSVVKHPYLIDINLMTITHSEDLIHLHSEFNYFRQHSKHGEVLYWHSEGTNLNASMLNGADKEMRKFLTKQLKDWNVDHIVQR